MHLNAANKSTKLKYRTNRILDVGNTYLSHNKYDVCLFFICFGCPVDNASSDHVLQKSYFENKIVSTKMSPYSNYKLVYRNLINDKNL